MLGIDASLLTQEYNLDQVNIDSPSNLFFQAVTTDDVWIASHNNPDIKIFTHSGGWIPHLLHLI